jgi:hypothetical protein
MTDVMLLNDAERPRRWSREDREAVLAACPRRGGHRDCAAVQGIDRPDLYLAASAEAPGGLCAREDSRTRIRRSPPRRSGGLQDADRACRRPYQRVGISPAVPGDGGVAGAAIIPIASGVRVWLATGHTVSLRRGFQLPTTPAAPISAPISISVNRKSPRQMTVLPGGGSLERAR